jgi:hypothetical protein
MVSQLTYLALDHDLTSLPHAAHSPIEIEADHILLV